ncbi:MAG: type I-C CRISPR-associated endonuclease Cas1c [Clostridia bacterium]|nr:type I-C CRISPR-associated endonuclease Cas1c [Clostridia bacterium]
MRKLLNTLYVTSPDAYLTRDGDNVIVRIENEVKFRMPIHNLESVVAFGYAGASPSLMQLCAERGVALTFLTEHGHFMARVTGEVSGNVLLRRRQYRVADSEAEASHIASVFILAKMANCRAVLLRAARDHETGEQTQAVASAADQLAGYMQEAAKGLPLDELRGIEGVAANTYFGVFDNLILANKGDFFFHARSRRPPRDNINALLSFLYTLLVHDMQAALESVGLDPQVGFMHQDRPGRPGLALDMMEELRPILADRSALAIVNRKQVGPGGFHALESGGVMMDDDTRKTVIAVWQKRKQEEIVHPFLGEKIEVGLIPYAQAMLMARYLRGDIDGYPAFFWK